MTPAGGKDEIDGIHLGVAALQHPALDTEQTQDV